MTRNTSVFTILLLLATLLVVASAPMSHAGNGKGPGGGYCNRKNCDTRPPTVSIANPTAGESVTGTAQMTGSAADNGEIVAIQVQVDDTNPWAADGGETWSTTLDTMLYADGSHLITVTATDMAGNVGAASVTVVVGNAPAPPPPPDDPPLPLPPPPPPPPSPATPVAPPVLAPGTIGGYVFQETDRDGVYENDEQALSNKHLFLFAGDGTYLGNTYSEANGWYAFAGLPDGTYRVEFAPAAWWAIREDWVPDTTGTVFPRRAVALIGSARADLGWRPIVRSTDNGSPLSSYVGPTGLTVKSYDDVVDAKVVHDRLVEGSLVGSEARFVTIRFDFAKSGSTSAVVSSSNGGPYESYDATSDVTYLSWLDGDGELFHEYGHAWSLYYAFIVQQDSTLAVYLAARALLGDPRVNSSYTWNVREMIAEDYRQLFGTPGARSQAQLNRDIPLAPDVPGLRDFLADTFTRAPVQ